MRLEKKKKNKNTMVKYVIECVTSLIKKKKKS